MPLIDHIDFEVSDFDGSRAFYVSALEPLGIEPVLDIERQDGNGGTGFGRGDDELFWIGGGSAIAGRLHIAFTADSRESVDSFYEAALAAGGTSKGEPGFRPRYGDNYYAAFVFDLDGHTIEAVCRF